MRPKCQKEKNNRGNKKKRKVNDSWASWEKRQSAGLITWPLAGGSEGSARGNI